MKRLVLFVFVLFSLIAPGAGAAQVKPDAQALIDKAIAAHGGRAAIAGIKTMTRLEVGRHVASDGQWFSNAWREIWDFAGRRYRNETLGNGLPYGVRQETAAGAVSWSWDKGLEKRDRNSYLVHLEDEVLHALLMPMRSATVLGTRTVFGVTGQAVTFTSESGLDTFAYLFAQDGTVLASSRDTDFFAGNTTFLYADHREVNGVRVFQSYREVRKGELTADYRALEVRVNEAIGDEVFRLPPPEAPKGRLGIAPAFLSGTGIEVLEVEPGSPAAKAGLLVGDVIVAVDGVNVTDWNDAKPNLLRGEPGTVVVLTVKRGGQTLQLTLTRVAI